MNSAISTIIFYFSFIALSSCQSSQSDLKKFESVLGYEKSQVLTKMTEAFENDYLANKYPSHSLSEQYHLFMKDLEKLNNPEKDAIISDENDRRFRQSGLIYEKYWFPDSVWILKNGVGKRWTLEGENGKRKSWESEIYGIDTSDPISHDSIVKAEFKIADFNSYGNYKKAINAVKQDSPFLEIYYELLDRVGFTSNSLWHTIISENELDITGPVERRVLVMQLVY